MFTTISLAIPTSWQAPELLLSSTPEENKLILEAGCQILLTSRNESAGLNNKDERQRLRNDSEAKISEIRMRLQGELEEEKRNSQKILAEKELQLSEEKKRAQRLLSEKDAQIDILTVYKSTSEIRISETRQQERDSLSEEITTLKNELARLKRSGELEIERIKHSSEAEISRIKHTSDEEHTRWIDRSRDEHSSLIEQLNTMKEERLTWLDGAKREREAAQLALEKERDAGRHEREKILSNSERERETLLQKLDEVKNATTAMQVRRANSSNKGGDNEREFLEIIMNTFGPSADFLYIKKELNAGDHRFEWEGSRIMVENKKGYTESALRGTGGLPKAIKDFTNNPDCNLLIFISEDTVVPDHAKPGDIDIGIVDKRPAIFLGNFARQDDKITYIISILMPIMRLLLKVYKKNDINEANDAEKLGDVIHKIQCLKNEYVTQFSSFQKTIKEFERQQTSGIDRLKNAATSLLGIFNSSLNSILNEETKLEPEKIEPESCVTYTNDVLQGMKMEPELQEIAKKLNISGRTKLTKSELIKRILEKEVIDL